MKKALKAWYQQHFTDKGWGGADISNVMMYLTLMALTASSPLSHVFHGKFEAIDAARITASIYILSACMHSVDKVMLRHKVDTLKRDLVRALGQRDTLIAINHKFASALNRMDKQHLAKYGIQISIRKPEDSVKTHLD